VGIEPTPFRTGTLNQRLNRSAKASYEKTFFSTHGIIARGVRKESIVK
jgi:hypothetical protein